MMTKYKTPFNSKMTKCLFIVIILLIILAASILYSPCTLIPAAIPGKLYIDHLNFSYPLQNIQFKIALDTSDMKYCIEAISIYSVSYLYGCYEYILDK